MYLPPHFREDRLDVQHELIRRHPLATLVTAGPTGLIANLLPCLIDTRGEFGTLRAHLSRGNPQWRELAEVDDCLLVFQGPQAYVTPSWYPSKQDTGAVVPTWNFVTVQAWGRPRLIEDATWLGRQIRDLTDMQEQGRQQPWQVGDAPEPFVAGMMRGIVGVEIPIRRIEGKWKVSQNRSADDRRGVMEGLRAEGPQGEAMAKLVAERSPGL